MKIFIQLSSALLIALACSCADAKQINKPAPCPVNYIVLLDLSDRLLLPGQVADDQALITAVFAQFRKAVFEKGLVIYSKDKFRVVIAPQEGIAYDSGEFMSKLYLDMESLSIGEKLNQVRSFEQALPSTLKELYTKASKGRKQTKAFAGCDLWKYFNEQLSSDIVAGADNRLVILTDGYLDFEKPKNMQKYKRRYTSTDFIQVLRKDYNWQTTMKQDDWGLLPANVELSNVSVSVAEISPKSGSLSEVPILQEVWRKWLREMHAPHTTLILRNNLSKSQALLQASLQKPLKIVGQLAEKGKPSAQLSHQN